MESLQQYYTHPDAMRNATRKKQNSLMYKEIKNFEKVVTHALGRFKLDLWYNMLSEVIPDSVEINSVAALQKLVQTQKQKLQESGEDVREDIVLMYFRDFFRDISQLRRMKDIFQTRLYNVLFEYYYDVDAIQEISDVAKSAEENNNHKSDGTSPMSKVKKKNLSQIRQKEQISSSRFPPEVVSELADDCIEISSLIGELKRLVFSWGRLLNDPEIDTQLFSTGNDDQFQNYDCQSFEAIFRLVPDILQKSHQAIVLARNWWFKAEKIQNRLSKRPPPPSRMISARDKDLHNVYDDDDDDDEDGDLGAGESGGLTDDDEYAEDKLEYSDEFNEEDIIEDYGENTLSEEDDDMFLKSDPGAIVIAQNNQGQFDDPPNNKYDTQNIRHEDNNNEDTYDKDSDAEKEVEGNGKRNKAAKPKLNAVKNTDKKVRKKRNSGSNCAEDSKNKDNADQKSDKNNKSKSKASKKSKSKKASPRKAKPAPAASENQTEPSTKTPFDEFDDTGDQMTKEKLKELNENIDAHQHELDIQIGELKTLYDRNHRVKSLCETLEDTIESQISQRKKAQELMTVKESLEELKIQKTTTPDKQKKIDRHLEKINEELDQILESGKLRDYQNELLKEDLELQLAVSPRLVLYGNQVQDQIESLEEQLEQEREKLDKLHEEYNIVSRKSRLEHRQRERLKAAERDGKNFSADAVNKTRKDDVARNKEVQRPAHHSDGSAGGDNLRDSHQSASSGSVYFNEGDVEEFDEEQFENELDIDQSLDDEIGEALDNDFGVSFQSDHDESLENDSGLSETWEEIGKASHDIPRTPAPPPRPVPESKSRKKTRGRPGAEPKDKETKPLERKPKANKQKEKKPPAESKVKEKKPVAASKQGKLAAKNKVTKPGDDDQAIKRADKKSKKVVDKKSPVKDQQIDRKKESPRKNKKSIKDEDMPEMDEEEEIEEDIEGVHNSASENETTGLAIFGSEYRYPDSDTGEQENGGLEDTKSADRDSNLEQQKSGNDQQERKRPDAELSKAGRKDTTNNKGKRRKREQEKSTKTLHEEPIGSEDDQDQHDDDVPAKQTSKATSRSKPTDKRNARKAIDRKERKSNKNTEKNPQLHDASNEEEEEEDEEEDAGKPIGRQELKTTENAIKDPHPHPHDASNEEEDDDDAWKPVDHKERKSTRNTKKDPQAHDASNEEEEEDEDRDIEIPDNIETKPKVSSKKPPTGKNANYQPKPPTNKSNRGRTRARGVPSKDGSTTDEDMNPREQERKVTKRRLSKGRRSRSQSRETLKRNQEKISKEEAGSPEDEKEMEEEEDNQNKSDRDRAEDKSKEDKPEKNTRQSENAQDQTKVDKKGKKQKQARGLRDGNKESKTDDEDTKQSKTTQDQANTKGNNRKHTKSKQDEQKASKEEEENQKQSGMERKNSRRQKGVKDKKDEKKDKRPPWRPNFGK